MRLPVFKQTNMLSPTPGERLTARPAVVFALWFLVLLVSQLGGTLLYDIAFLLIPDAPLSARILLQLFSTLSTVIAVLLYCLLAEKRRPVTLGLRRKGAVAEYALGLAGGLLLFGGAVLLSVLCGALTVRPASIPPSLGILLLYLVGFLIQGMSEELLCRSYLMVSLSRGWPLWLCAVTNSLLFSLLHISNPGISVIALINIFLFGLFASMLTLRRGSIWMVGALHSMWNFAQGNVFGIPVSGISGSPSPLVSTLAPGTWAELVNGGAFGLEAGLAVTVMLAAACAVALFMPTKRSEIAETNE